MIELRKLSIKCCQRYSTGSHGKI